MMFTTSESTSELEKFEKRTFTKWEKVTSVSSFTSATREFTKYIKDNFGLRKDFSQTYAKLKYHITSQSHDIDKYAVGKNGWLFLNDDHYIDRSYGNTNLDSHTVEYKVNILKKRADWLHSKGIKYYILYIPKKTIVYPELIPNQYQTLVKNRRTSSADIILDKLRGYPNLEIINTTDVILKSKSKKHPLYLKTDTHWTHYGAFIAYRKFISSLCQNHKNINPELDYEDVKFSQVSFAGIGDLESYSNMPNTFSSQDVIASIINNQKENISTTKNPKKYTSPLVYMSKLSINPNQVNSPKILFYHDSFMLSLMKFIKPHFSESLFLWARDFDKSMVNEFKPDILVHEFYGRVFESYIVETE